MTKEQVREVLDAMAFPTLGDSAKKYAVMLTEPEINTIHAACGFMRSATAGFKRYWEHYGPTFEELSKRLSVFDD
jgi:hypothetical protein